MKNPITAALILSLAALPLATRAESCCETCTAPVKPAETSAESATAAPAGHPLRGVVVEILADRQSLLVKHEEIPGVMKAMTMVFKVDAAVLATVTKGQLITATLVEQNNDWSLIDVKPVAAHAAE